MQLIDANVVIRYLLQDNEVLSKKATELIEQNHDVYIVNEVVAEIIYVLLKVYELPKEKIVQSLQLLFAKNLLKHTQPILIKHCTYYLSTSKYGFCGLFINCLSSNI